LQFVVSGILIMGAGTLLARFADKIPELTGLGRLLVGSVLLAGATSLPELTVDTSAVRLGLADLAVGDLLGSSLMNLMILAVLDLSNHVVRQAEPKHEQPKKPASPLTGWFRRRTKWAFVMRHKCAPLTGDHHTVSRGQRLTAEPLAI
jgi:Sodium/calcium exchanger protein